MVRLEDIKDNTIKEYLRQQTKRFDDLKKYVENAIKSRAIIHLTLSNRLEALEKKGK